MTVMQLRRILLCFSVLPMLAASRALAGPAQNSSSSRSSSSSKRSKPVGTTDAELEAGSVREGVYRNKTLGFTYKIPAGWVLRTEEMSAPQEEKIPNSSTGSPTPASSAGAKVLLAAFSRPPEAKGEDVNSSVLIVAESAAAYPGLKDAAQYFGPLTEVAKAQGFTGDEEPYEFAVATKTLVRGDFHKDVGTRVMRQSTLAMLAHGYAVSFTVIGGTEDEVEELVDRLSFAESGKTRK